MHIIMYGTWKPHQRWLCCICQIKSRRWNLLTSRSLPYPLILFSSRAASFFPSTVISVSPISPPIHCLSSPHLTCPLLSLYSTLLAERWICLLILIPHTKGGWIISFLSHPAWIGPLQNSHTMPCLPKSGLLPIIPHLLSHSSLIFGSLILGSFLRFHNQQFQDVHSLRWCYCFELA